jgi:hypothetical protein
VVTTGWDASPRCRQDVPWPFPVEPASGRRVYPYVPVVVGNTPERFEQLLRDAAEHIERDPRQPFAVLLNAWNEWTEGCYLLPEQQPVWNCGHEVKHDRVRIVMAGFRSGFVRVKHDEVRFGLDLHVSADAAAGGDGSRQKPYQTLTQARDAIRARRKAGDAGQRGSRHGPCRAGRLSLGRLVGIERRGQWYGRSADRLPCPRGRHSAASGRDRVGARSFQPVSDAAVLSRLDPTAGDKVLVCDLSAKAPAGFPNSRRRFAEPRSRRGCM